MNPIAQRCTVGKLRLRHNVARHPGWASLTDSIQAQQRATEDGYHEYLGWSECEENKKRRKEDIIEYEKKEERKKRSKSFFSSEDLEEGANHGLFSFLREGSHDMWLLRGYGYVIRPCSFQLHIKWYIRVHGSLKKYILSSMYADVLGIYYSYNMTNPRLGLLYNQLVSKIRSSTNQTKPWWLEYCNPKSISSLYKIFRYRHDSRLTSEYAPIQEPIICLDLKSLVCLANAKSAQLWLHESRVTMLRQQRLLTSYVSIHRKRVTLRYQCCSI